MFADNKCLSVCIFFLNDFKPLVFLFRYFQMFLDSLCSPEGKFPEHLEEEVLRPALVARFRVARLYSKLICSLPSVHLDNLNKSLENYK